MLHLIQRWAVRLTENSPTSSSWRFAGLSTMHEVTEARNLGQSERMRAMVMTPDQHRFISIAGMA